MEIEADGRRILLILGMHRSGTSCLAGCLEAAGLRLGAVNNKAPYNAKGNKESRSLMDFQDGVLARSTASWDSVPSDLQWTAEDEQELKHQLHANFDSAGLWGSKDPRTLLLIEIWKAADIALQFVGTVRHPHAVAQSLQSRNGFSEEKCFALWLAYNSKLLQQLQENPFPVMNYDWPSRTYKDRVEHLAGLLGLPEPAQASAFYTEDLRHAGPIHSPVPEAVEDVYRQLLTFTESWS